MNFRINLPSVIVWSSSDASTSKDSLAFDKHFFARRKHVSVGNHEVLGNVWVRNNDEQLVSKPDGIYVSELLRPVVQSQLRIPSQRAKGTYESS